jgi:hypothetical protein
MGSAGKVFERLRCKVKSASFSTWKNLLDVLIRNVSYHVFLAEQGFAFFSYQSKMLRFRSHLFAASVRKFIDAAKLIAPSLKGEDLTAVALTLQANERELAKERLMRENEKELLMQQFAPMYNQRALDDLVKHLRESKKFQHHVVEFKGSRRNSVNMAATANKMRAYLETEGCTNKREMRALRKIYQDLSDELQSMPLPMSIESARWAGLTPGQQQLMDTVYLGLSRKDTVADAL